MLLRTEMSASCTWGNASRGMAFHLLRQGTSQEEALRCFMNRIDLQCAMCCLVFGPLIRRAPPASIASASEFIQPYSYLRLTRVTTPDEGHRSVAKRTSEEEKIGRGRS